MDRMNRIFGVHRILASSRYPVSRGRLQEELVCSRATLTRILAEMRDLLGAPIEYDEDRHMVENWFKTRTDVKSYDVKALVDAWHSPRSVRSFQRHRSRHQIAFFKADENGLTA